MQDELYKIFGLTPEASDEELDARYKELKKKYSEDRFLEGEAGNDAAKKLTQLEAAYADLKSLRKESAAAGGNSFADVESAIRQGRYDRAQALLDAFGERNAEWHYLQSVVFYKKNWANECKKQLEIAIQMDPDNEKYKQAYDRLNEKVNAEQQQFRSGSGAGAAAYADEGEQPQMGGNFCTDTLNCCAQFICCNSLLNCCCNCR